MIQNLGDKANTNGLAERKENINRNGRPKKFNARLELQEIADSGGMIEVSKDQIVEKDGKIFVNVGNARGVISKAFEKANEGDMKAINLLFDSMGLKGKAGIAIQNNYGTKHEPKAKYDLTILSEDERKDLSQLLTRCAFPHDLIDLEAFYNFDLLEASEIKRLVEYLKRSHIKD